MEQMLLPLLLFVALGAMMFFSTRRQKRQVAQQQAMQNALSPGARVMTTSGLHGEITAVADDTIELEIAPGVRTTWVRAAIRDVVVPNLADPTDEHDGPAINAGSDEVNINGEVSLNKNKGDSTDVS